MREFTKLRTQYSDIDRIFNDNTSGKKQGEKIEEINDLVEKVAGKRFSASAIYHSFKHDNLENVEEKKEKLKNKIDSIQDFDENDLNEVMIKNKKLNELSFEKIQELIIKGDMSEKNLVAIFNQTSISINSYKKTINELKEDDENKDEDKDKEIKAEVNIAIGNVELFKKDEFERKRNSFIYNKNEYDSGGGTDEEK